jgi:hypothetical protein
VRSIRQVDLLLARYTCRKKHRADLLPMPQAETEIRYGDTNAVSSNRRGRALRHPDRSAPGVGLRFAVDTRTSPLG